VKIWQPKVLIMAFRCDQRSLPGLESKLGISNLQDLKIQSVMRLPYILIQTTHYQC
jgi:hypothetical protein